MFRALPVLVVCLACGALGCEGALSTHSHPEPKMPPTARRCPPPRQTVVDLTHVMHEAMPFWPGGVPFKMERIADYDQGYRAHRFEMGENTGTHVDAPSHLVEGKADVAALRADQLVVPLAVLDVKAKVEKDPDYRVSGADIVDWEAIHGPVPVGSLLVVNTGWHKRFEDAAKYINQDAEGVMHFPGLSAEAAQLLVDRDVAAVGIDTLSIDPGSTSELAAHKVLLTAGKFAIENLANLDAVPETGATAVIGVLPVAGGTEAQARVLALVPEKKDDDPDEPEVAE